MQSSGLILMYHRVINNPLDPWQLAVSPKNFEGQLQVLKASRKVVSLPTLIETLTSGKRIKSFIAVTFDDGYADNFLYAKPLLEKYEIPATFFVANKHIGSLKSFWWDELSDLMLGGENFPEYLTLNIEGEPFSMDFSGERVLTEELHQLHKGWNANHLPPTKRSEFYMKLWRKLSIQNYDNQTYILKELKKLLNFKQIPDMNHISMTDEQLRLIAENKLFHFGGHTVTHPMMSGHPEEFQSEEVFKNKKYLESVTGQVMEAFAYPYGNFNSLSIDIVRSQGFKAAVTTDAKLVKSNQDPYQLGRFQVLNWEKQAFQRMLNNWTQA